jgi:hypothetical protein
MTSPLPPLNEPQNNDTERSNAQQTRPQPPIQVTPPRGTPVVLPPNMPQTRQPAPPQTQQPVRGGHVAPPTGATGGMRPVQPTGNVPRRVPPRPRQTQPLYLPWWSVVLMLIVVLVIAFSIVGLVVTLGANQPSLATTPIIRIITAVPTLPNGNAGVVATSAPLIQVGGNNSSEQQALAGPTLEAIAFTPTPIAVTVGSTVAVAGVEQEQLNVRDNAGVQGTTILFRAIEGTNFVVVEGPAQADGFTWWKIQNALDPSQSGWAVANYLQVVVGQ